MSFFITFEGIEGCGKTTQIGHLTSFLKKNQRPFLLTREPGGTKVGEKIRQILLSSDNAGMEPMAELFLYVADRIQHYRQVIVPALREGKVVLCDRFADATTVYQGFGRGLDLAWIEEIHARVLENTKPDLTFLLDLPVEVGLKRAWKRLEKDQTREDRFEKEAVDFHQKVREGYLILARKEPARIIVLDGMKDEQTLHREIVSHLPGTIRG
ncbi:MAG: dTMP kinase [Deltaproteobacteria bacterium]|nr:dTMP kinase [Deltaproteobacteria bacterium]